MRQTSIGILLLSVLMFTGCTTAETPTVDSTAQGAIHNVEPDHEIPELTLPENWPEDAPLPSEYTLHVVTDGDPFFQADLTTPLTYADAILFTRSEYSSNGWELTTELENETSYTFTFVEPDTKRTAAISVFEQQDSETRISIVISEVIEQ